MNVKKLKVAFLTVFAIVVFLSLGKVHTDRVIQAQSPGPSMLVPNLDVRTVVSGLVQPTSMAFIGPNDFLVLEKASGKVQRVTNGTISGTVLDLGVNSASERGLLGIALHPNFPANPGVYLYWTCQAPPPPAASPFVPTLTECPDPPQLVADTANI